MPSGNALLLLPLLWAAVTICWAPMLLSARIRTLFGRWPTDSPPVNYPLVIGGVVLVHLALFLALTVALSGTRLHVLHFAAATAVGVPAAGWLLVVGLPHVSDVETPDGVWLPLAVGAAWYAVVVGVVSIVVVFVLFVIYFPG